MAVEQAVWALRNTVDVTASREALARLAEDGALSPEMRELAAQGLA